MSGLGLVGLIVVFDFVTSEYCLSLESWVLAEAIMGG